MVMITQPRERLVSGRVFVNAILDADYTTYRRCIFLGGVTVVGQNVSLESCAIFGSDGPTYLAETSSSGAWN